MILSWMLYAVVVSALLSAAALALERIIRLRSRPARWLWLAALAVSASWPILAWLWPSSAGLDTRGSGAVEPLALEPLGAVSGVAARFGWLNDALALVWAILSVGLLCRLFASSRVLARRRGWRRDVVDGVSVLISRATGPAVTGPAKHAIVLPCWALELEPKARSLLLAHEREHELARDGWLILASRVAPALLPWNPAMWWQARRLRLAIETDCDARVLGGGATAAEYGAMLLDVARRASGHRPAAAAFLLEPRTFLERRIRIMTMTMPKYKRAKAALYCGLAVAALVIAAACDAPEPADQGNSSATANVVTPTTSTAPSEIEPLVYIDGVRIAIGNRPMEDLIDPGDVARIEVIKGEAAVNVFGPKARAGVIQIFTKSQSNDVDATESAANNNSTAESH